MDVPELRAKKAEFLLLGMELYRLSAKMGDVREELEGWLTVGYAFSSPEVIETNNRHTDLAVRFMEKEKSYRALMEELQTEDASGEDLELSQT